MKIKSSFLKVKRQSILFLLVSFFIAAVKPAMGQTYTASYGTYTLSYTVSGSNATITGATFDTSFNGTLTIPATVINGTTTYNVTSINAKAFQDNTNITSLTLSEGLKTIGASAFSGSKIAGTINLPVSLTTMGAWCFASMFNIDAVVFPSNSAVTVIPDDAFKNSAIKSINFPPNLTSIGVAAYYGCNNVETAEIILPTTLKTIGNSAFAFWRKTSTIPVFPGKNKLVFPENSQLTSIGYSAFRNGNWYGDITLPAGVTKIDSLTFLRNEQWEGQITLPSTLKEIGNFAFELVGSTQNLVIPASVTTIGKSAFYASPFFGITFEAGSQLTSLGPGAFKSCFNLSYVDLSSITELAALDASRDPASTSQYASMPNYTMVYLPAGSKVAANQVNFVVSGKCDNFVLYDYDDLGNYHSITTKTIDNDRTWVGENTRYEPNAPTPENFGMQRGCDYHIPMDFTAAKASYVNRKFEAVKGKTYTVILPCNAVVPEGMKAYQLKKLLTAENMYYFLYTGSNQLKAYEPYVLCVVDPAKSLTFPDITDCKIKATPDTEAAQTGWVPENELQFIGTTTNILNADARNKGNYNLSGGIWYPVFTKEGTTWNGTNTATDAQNGYKGYIHSMRAFVRKPTSGSGAGAKFLMFLDDRSETTGIQDFEKKITTDSQKIYTTDGRYVGTDFDALPSGEIYIIAGKKVYKL